MKALKKVDRQKTIKKLFDFDKKACVNAQEKFGKSFLGIIGVDEVGRGSLIGSVVACAVMFHTPPEFTRNKKHEFLHDLDDSKAMHLTHEKRLVLSETLKQICCWGIGEACKTEIESMNIHHASLLAFSRAFAALEKHIAELNHVHTEHLVLLDGKFTIPKFHRPQLAVIDGDAQSAAIAAASIIAKAHRDTWVIRQSHEYPGYGWETNMGYSTPAHKLALKNLGLTPWHRQTYKAVRDVSENNMQLNFL